MENINNDDLENVPTTDGGISQHNYAIWYRLYNPNSDVGLGQKGDKGDKGDKGMTGEDGSFGGATFDYTFNQQQQHNQCLLAKK